MVDQETKDQEQSQAAAYAGTGSQANSEVAQEKSQIKRRPFLFRPSKKLFIPILCLVLVALGLGVYLLMNGEDKQPTNESPAGQASQTEEPQEPGVISMLATGDWIAHDAINAQAKQADGSYNYTSMTAGMKTAFSQGDINFCNLATLAGGEKFGVTGYPIFNAPTSWIDAMDDLGCNLYNTGTNHTNDKGQPAISAELDYLDTKQAMLAQAGANRSSDEQRTVRYFELKGVTFAFLSYGTYSNSPNPNPYSLNRFEEPLVTEQMTEARSRADIVIVSMRWGTEYSDLVNEAQKSQAQKLADLGADIVLGHGTHTLQPVDKLAGLDGRETVIWYGLGNFLNAQLETGGLTGCVADIKIDAATKKVTHTMCLPFYMHYEWTAEEKAREDLLARKNFNIMPLFNAADWMAKSQLDTTVEAQMERIRAAVNTYTEVPVQNATDL